MKTDAMLSVSLQAFFMERLMNQKNASAHTIANYRDTFRLLLSFAQRSLRRAPSALQIQDIDAPFIISFLDYLERDRKNTPQTRNTRLAAVHSFFRYVALQEPGASAVAQRVLAIPGKRHKTKPVDFLSRAEVASILAAPDQSTWAGRRDRTLMLVAVQTGLRVSELIGLRSQDVALGAGAHVRCFGKGRKERCTPLRKDAVVALRSWLGEHNPTPSGVLFPNARGQRLSRDGVEFLLAKHVATARLTCHSLQKKRVSPHVLRHTTAMDLLQHGIDRSVIALWLGHESMDSTQAYLHADLQLKEQALAKTQPFGGQQRRYKPTDRLLAFLREL